MPARVGSRAKGGKQCLGALWVLELDYCGFPVVRVSPSCTKESKEKKVAIRTRGCCLEVFKYFPGLPKSMAPGPLE